MEVAVVVSPHALRTRMDRAEDDFILIDLRSPAEYAAGHIRRARNIPVYRDPDTPVYDEVSRIVEQFRALPEVKDTIVYCYSAACMSGRKVGRVLAENGIFVRHLGIGWNEWRHHWTDWNHEHEWKTKVVDDYIASGEPSGSNGDQSVSCDC